MSDSNMWNQRYADEIYAYGKEPNQFLVKAAAALPAGNILCIGEGEGRNAVFLAGKGYHVLAVDLSAVGLEKARRLAFERSVFIDTQVTDLAEFNIKQNFWNGIVNIFCHLPEDIRKPLHRKIVSGLKPGGVYILEAYSTRQLNNITGGPRQLDLLLDLTTIKSELSGLSFTHAIEIERNIIEGQYHTGIGTVVQIIAKKII